jgi:tetratricopeptide (TPR) repeat protein
VLAAALTKQNDFEGALHAYEAWVSILPEDPAALTYLGGVQAAMGDFAAAEKNLRHALANDPNYTTALLNYGTLLLKLDHPAAAEPYLRRAVQLAPQDAKSRWNLARCLAALGRREDAVTQLQIAYTRQANPAIIEMLRELGAGPSTTMPAP